MKTLSALVLTLALVGCHSRSLAMDDDKADLRDASTPDDLFGADLSGADLRPTAPLDLGPAQPPGEIGDGCSLPLIPTDEGPQQGTCAAGNFCVGSGVNSPGGYCSRKCDQQKQDCPSDAYCVSLPTNYCLKRCKTKQDCRAGYICDDDFVTDGVPVCSVEFPTGS